MRTPPLIPVVTLLCAASLLGSARTAGACDWYAAPGADGGAGSKTSPYRVADFWGRGDAVLCL
ncbi:MAG: hypothetical protein O7G30_16425 [Proteobacteria bacterium]|nr:hypothetical protein [Pseudomonadota bacterium]